MTEAEWLACTEPEKMLRFIWQKATNRKLRLFQCAWCRRMPYPLTDPRSLTAVDTGERYAEGLVHEEERQAAWEAAWLVVENAVADQQWEQAAGAADARRCVETTKYRMVRVEQPGSVWHPEQCWLFRELFGPLPFCSISLAPAWLSWHGGLLVSMAQQMYDSRDFRDMPVLADALEEAGCDNADILAHCRQPGSHVRGCWVVDLLLGKS